MTQLGDNVLKVIKEKGWLAVSYLTFDNSMNLNVFHSSGNCAISESSNCCYWLAVNDSANSQKIENTFVSMDPHRLGLQTTLVEQDMDCLQHLTYNMYAHADFFEPENQTDPLPYPKLPTPDELEAMTYDEETGLYTGAPAKILNYHTHTAITEKTPITEISGYPLYEQFDPNLVTLNSFAIISEWKTFYENHKRFIKMLESYLGITGCV